jgi:NTE family protein
MGNNPETPEEDAGSALVLTGGGARAAYQVGVLAALAQQAPGVEFPILTGASAGAINTAFLASHPGPLSKAIASLKEQWAHLTADMIYGPRAPTLIRSTARWLEQIALGRRDQPTSSRGLFDTRPLRAFLERAIDFGGIDANISRGRLRALALTATSYGSGQTITFVQGTPDVSMWERAHRMGVRARISLDHLMASAAIPLVFPAVQLADGFYGDGSVRQTFPLSPAIHLGARRILAIGTRPNLSPPLPGGPSTYPSVAQSLGLLLDSVFMDHLDADAEVLESINRLQAQGSLGEQPLRFRPVDFLLFRPSQDLGEIARECIEGLPRFLRTVARSLGAEKHGGAEFLSYLLFDPAYTGKLFELGFADGIRDWPRVEKLLIPSDASREADVSR